METTRIHTQPLTDAEILKIMIHEGQFNDNGAEDALEDLTCAAADLVEEYGGPNQWKAFVHLRGLLKQQATSE